MNILISATHNFKPMVGGIAEYTHNVAKHLSLLGNKVIIMSVPMNNDDIFDSNCTYQVVRVGKKNVRATALRIINEYKIDCIIANECGSSIDDFRLISWFKSIPLIMFVHGRELTAERSPIVRLKIFLSLHLVDRIITVSTYTRQLAIKMGKKSSEIFMITPGIEPAADVKPNIVKEMRQKLGLSDEAILFSVSRLIKRKGFDNAIRGFARVVKSSSKCIYILGGTGPETENLLTLVRDLGVESKFKFTGPLSDEEKNALYEICDVFIMPNRQLSDGDVEGFGIVFLEANVHGKPVIAGRSGGAIDAVEDGKSGILVDPLNIDEISRAIELLLFNREKSLKLGEYGRQRALTEFSWATVAQSMHKVLSDYVDSRRKKTV